MKLNIYETNFETEMSEGLEYLSENLEGEEAEAIKDKIESYVTSEQIDQLIFAFKQRKVEWLHPRMDFHHDATEQILRAIQRASHWCRAIWHFCAAE